MTESAQRREGCRAIEAIPSARELLGMGIRGVLKSPVVLDLECDRNDGLVLGATCPAVSAQKALLGKPAVAPRASLIYQEINPLLFSRTAIQAREYDSQDIASKRRLARPLRKH